MGVQGFRGLGFGGLGFRGLGFGGLGVWGFRVFVQYRFESSFDNNSGVVGCVFFCISLCFFGQCVFVLGSGSSEEVSVYKSSLLKGFLTECYESAQKLFFASSRLSLDRWFMVLSGCIQLYAGRSGCKSMGCGIS